MAHSELIKQKPGKQELIEKIAARDFTVAVVGMGYVGLPLAAAFARQGFDVIGVDVDPKKVEMLNQGLSYLQHIGIESLVAAKDKGRFEASSNYDVLKRAHAVLLCVPTPLNAHQEPEMRYVVETAQEVEQHLQTGQLVVLESTTYPGTTDELLVQLLSGSGKKVGEDFFLAYSPEREDPGNATYGTSNIPKLVGGIDDASGELAYELYSAVISSVIRVKNARVAEAAKLTENVFRAVNIALVNELKVTFERMDLNVWEVLDAAATKPFGFMRFNPGPGWGGHCIPVDPFYLSWKARQFGAPPKFIELAGELNIRMHEYVVERLILGLNGQRKAVSGSRVLLLGVAYKKNVDDCRESPAFPIMDSLLKMGAELRFHDPFVSKIPSLRDWPQLAGKESVELTTSELEAAEAVLIVTDHDEVDYAMVQQHASLVVDTRGILAGDPPNVVRA